MWVRYVSKELGWGDSSMCFNFILLYFALYLDILLSFFSYRTSPNNFSF